MKFEKWQALGNDYVIVEESSLPFALTAGRVKAICAPHTGVCADGMLLLSEPDSAESVARLRVFNPDGSEAEVSGNGAREAILYLYRRGVIGESSFSIKTMAGELRPTITSDRTCTVGMGRARLRSDDYPGGSDSGQGELVAGGREWRFQHVQVGNPQCAIRVDDPDELASLDLTELGPQIERHELFPNRTNVSWFVPQAEGQIRVRIFERGVGETAASGTGASGAAVAHVLQGGTAPVQVRLDGGELEVDVSADLDVTLTGWAVPVYSGELSRDFIEALHAL